MSFLIFITPSIIQCFKSCLKMSNHWKNEGKLHSPNDEWHLQTSFVLSMLDEFSKIYTFNHPIFYELFKESFAFILPMMNDTFKIASTSNAGWVFQTSLHLQSSNALKSCLKMSNHWKNEGILNSSNDECHLQTSFVLSMLDEFSKL